MNATSNRAAGRPGARTRVLSVAALLCTLVTSCGGGAPEKTGSTVSGSTSSNTSAASSPATSTTTTTKATCDFKGALTVPGDTSLSRLTVMGVRAGRQECFDRLVIDLSGDNSKKPGYQVRYVPKVLEDGSGRPVVLRGGAFLHISVGAPSYDTSGQPTFLPADKNEVADVAGFTTFKQVAWAGSFEGMTTIGVGVREQLPFKVQVLEEDGKTRLVVDVAHQAKP